MNRWILIGGMGLVFGILPQQALAASMQLTPTEIKSVSGQRHEITLMVDAQKDRVVGVDVKIRYPKGGIKVVEVADLHGFSRLVATKEIDGGIDISFANDYGVVSSGKIEVAKLTVEAVAEGLAELEIKYEKDGTRDTNVVVESGADVLTEVRGMRLITTRKIRGEVLGVALTVPEEPKWVWIAPLGIAGGMVVMGFVMYNKSTYQV